jgi:signal transduction histidine kinase
MTTSGQMIRCPVWLLGLLLGLWASGVTAAEFTFDRAEVLDEYAGAGPPGPDISGHLVSLPGTANMRLPGRTQLVWIRLRFNLEHLTNDRAYGLYLQRVDPEPMFYANGAFIGGGEHLGQAGPGTWNFPVFQSLPGSVLHRGPNEILIAFINPVESENHFFQVSRVVLGPVQSLYPRYLAQLRLQVIGIEVVSLLVAVIGLFLGVLWWRRRSNEIFGLFALSCGLWVLRNSQFFVTTTALPLYFFRVLTDASLFWLVAVLFVMSFRILDRRFPRLERALFGYAIAGTLLMYALGRDYSDLVKNVFYAGLLPMCLVFIGYVLMLTWRQRTVLTTLLCLAATVTSMTGAYDLLLMLRLLPWPAAYLMPYSALVYAVTIGWALIDQFVLAHNRFEQLNAELEARVRLREQELDSHYRLLAGMEREQAVTTERERILRDMHDGLGLQLISSMRLAEKGELSGPQVSELFTEAMDELRIAIDSIKPTAQDLLEMLGNLRYRLEPRLNAAGMTLHWDIDSTAARLPPLPAEQVVELTRIAQESIANALKHARATELTLRVRTDHANKMEIALIDNGRGFDAQSINSGEGLKNMRRRAHKIGAQLSIQSNPGQTTVSVNLGS